MAIKNTGSENTGYGNSGHRNSGNRNSGYGNSGYWNSGYWNSGYGNSGNRNSGYGNSGYGNSTDRESGIFCNAEGKVRMFNKPTNLTWDEIDHPHFTEFYLCKWISESEMTDEEKKADTQFYVRGGYLKTYTYKDAWSNFWKDTDEENRKKFLALPNFDADVFLDITGIDVRKQTLNLKGKEVKVALDGVEYVAVIK